ncbi:hypothetical protein OBP_182 [Pseudomonas phage OBP]|uniref:hypothetical protein n=1 Tax=Pseudomonas phage OBP TaxID=1124849 RepID=UPI000240D596|nr:hypothetical protein OBP_182 [Pseudomonas phage OBP]AEV89619.1 hypothetical protein OBP_182 [Pseudomonas phage OBP]
MFKAIWKGVKWFFKQPDDSKLPVRGKPMFSQPGQVPRVGTNIPVNRNVEGRLVAGEKEQGIMSSYAQMVALTNSDTQAIELAQSKRFGPHALTEAEIEYVLENSDIAHQKDKVIKAINLALNFQYARYTTVIDEAIAKIDAVIEQPSVDK